MQVASQSMVSRARLALLAACMVALGAGCNSKVPGASASGSSPGAERALEILVATEIDTLDPRVTTEAAAMRISRLVHAGLFRLDEETLRPIPYAAQQFAWVTPRTLRVVLREDVQFASGAPFEAIDVVRTFEAFRAPSSRHRRVVDAIERVEAEDPHTVLVHLSRAHGTLLSDLELPILRRDQAQLAPNGAFETLDGLGPFRVKQRDAGAIHLARRHGGALPKPLHDLVFRTVRDENARALRLRGGSADIAMNGFSPSLLPRIDGLTIESRAAASLTYLLPRWKDALPLVVRRALSLGLDRELFASALFLGHAEIAHGLMPRLHWAATAQAAPPAMGAMGAMGGAMGAMGAMGAPAVDDAVRATEPQSRSGEPQDAYAFDPKRARALLEQAGYQTDGADPRLRLSLLTSTDRMRVSVARVAAQELQHLGFQLEVIPLELGSMIARLAAGDFDLAILQIPELTEPNALKTFLHSTSIPPMGSNRGRVADAALDAALDTGEQESDMGARIAAYAAVELRTQAVLPIIPLWHEHHITLKSQRAAGFHPSADGRWLSLARMP
jgi:peptide/nickel transport system substrate-binding protein